MLSAHISQLLGIDYAGTTLGSVMFATASVLLMITACIWMSIPVLFAVKDTAISARRPVAHDLPALFVSFLWMAFPVPLVCFSKGDIRAVEVNWLAPLIGAGLSGLVYGLWIVESVFFNPNRGDIRGDSKGRS